MSALQLRGLTQQRACELVGYSRSNLHYKRGCTDDASLKACVHELAQERPRRGWRRLYMVMRRREGYDVGETRFLRIYRALQLQVRPRKKRKVNYVRGTSVQPVTKPNERWWIDFMHDRLANGRTYRSLNVCDDFTKECLALGLSHSFGSADVIRVFEALTFERSLPSSVRFDNGSEFRSRAMLRWSAERRVICTSSNPASRRKTQTSNRSTARSATSSSTDTVLRIFLKPVMPPRTWRIDYNQNRPRSALGYRTPKEFAESMKINPPPSQFSAA